MRISYRPDGPIYSSLAARCRRGSRSGPWKASPVSSFSSLSSSSSSSSSSSPPARKSPTSDAVSRIDAPQTASSKSPPPSSTRPPPPHSPTCSPPRPTLVDPWAKSSSSRPSRPPPTLPSSPTHTSIPTTSPSATSPSAPTYRISFLVGKLLRKKNHPPFLPLVTTHSLPSYLLPADPIRSCRCYSHARLSPSRAHRPHAHSYSHTCRFPLYTKSSSIRPTCAQSTYPRPSSPGPLPGQRASRQCPHTLAWLLSTFSPQRSSYSSHPGLEQAEQNTLNDSDINSDPDVNSDLDRNSDQEGKTHFRGNRRNQSKRDFESEMTSHNEGNLDTPSEPSDRLEDESSPTLCKDTHCKDGNYWRKYGRRRARPLGRPTQDFGPKVANQRNENQTPRRGRRNRDPAHDPPTNPPTTRPRHDPEEPDNAAKQVTVTKKQLLELVDGASDPISNQYELSLLPLHLQPDYQPPDTDAPTPSTSNISNSSSSRTPPFTHHTQRETDPSKPTTTTLPAPDPKDAQFPLYRDCLSAHPELRPIYDALGEAIRQRNLDPDRMSLDALLDLCDQVPEPRMHYLPGAWRHQLLRIFALPDRKTTRSMFQYVGLVADVKLAQLPLLRSEWNYALHYASHFVHDATESKLEATLRLWSEMERSSSSGSGSSSSSSGSTGQVRPSSANEITFNILFHAAVRSAHFTLAKRIFQEMERRAIRVNRYHHVSLIFYYGLRLDSRGVRAAYREMVLGGELIDTVVLNCVVTGLLNCGEEAEALRVYERMRRLQRPAYTPPPADRQYHRARLQTRVLLMFSQVARRHPRLRRRLQRTTGLAPDSKTFAVLIRHFAVKLGDLARAVQLLDEMKGLGVAVHASVFLSLFAGFAAHGGPRPECVWSGQRLQNVFSSFVEAVDRQAPGLYIDTWLCMSVLRAFRKCFEQDGVIVDVFYLLKERWLLDPGKVSFLDNYLQILLEQRPPRSGPDHAAGRRMLASIRRRLTWE